MEINALKVQDKINNTNWVFDTVQDMKNNSNKLKIGDNVRTLGYYTIGDNGGASYEIKDVEEDDENWTIQLNGKNAQLIGNNINLKMFGAKEDDGVDQSEVIKDAISFCIKNKIEKLELMGNYFIGTTVGISNISNLTITNGTIYVHEDDSLLSTGFNIFYFNACSNINIEKVNFIEKNPVQRIRKLRVGGIVFNNCDYCSITDCYLENLCSGIIFLQDTKNSIAMNNVINVPFQSSQFSQSAILNYASKNNIISQNKIYGEFYDGTLSIFGGGTTDVLVTNNELHNIVEGNTPIYISQGITIDQGPKRTIVEGNIIHDMFYGIDNKAGTYDTKIVNNILVGCKISIADRQGEAENTNYSFGISITNNKIIIQEDWDENLGSYLHYQEFFYVGIVSQMRYNANIKGNEILLYGKISHKVLGIDSRMPDDSTAQYQQTFDISNNNIEFATGILTTNSNAPSGSVGCIINNVRKGNFVNNTFKVDTTTNSYEFYQIRGNNYYLLITNNNCYMTSVQNHYFVKMFDSTSTISNSIIQSNILRNCNFDNLNDVTNLVEYSMNNVVNRTKSIQVSTDWADAFKIYSLYNYPVIIHIEALASYAGIKVINGIYRVTINGTSVNFEALQENNSGFEVQFINLGDTGYATCQIKSTATFNSSVDITRFKPINFINQYLVNIS